MYNKIFTKILDSSIWMESITTRIVWVTLLASMDEDGFCSLPSVANVAHRARVDLADAATAIACLECPDENSSDPDNEGRRLERVPGGWIVRNAQKYRHIVTRENAKDRNRERALRHRQKATPRNADVTPRNADVTVRNGSVTPCNGSVTPCNGPVTPCNGPVTVRNGPVTPSEADTEAYTDTHTENTGTDKSVQPPPLPEPDQPAKRKRVPKPKYPGDECIARHAFKLKGNVMEKKAALRAAIQTHGIEAVDAIDFAGVWPSDVAAKMTGTGEVCPFANGTNESITWHLDRGMIS